jgi:hypothetical protein
MQPASAHGLGPLLATLGNDCRCRRRGTGEGSEGTPGSARCAERRDEACQRGKRAGRFPPLLTARRTPMVTLHPKRLSWPNAGLVPRAERGEGPARHTHGRAQAQGGFPPTDTGRTWQDARGPLGDYTFFLKNCKILRNS